MRVTMCLISEDKRDLGLSIGKNNDVLLEDPTIAANMRTNLLCNNHRLCRDIAEQLRLIADNVELFCRTSNEKGEHRERA